MACNAHRIPCAFLGHGGGPLPLLGAQPKVADTLRNYPASLGGVVPSAILVITAHWVSDTVTVNSAQSPKLMYDYGGFPAETYEYKYPAQGSPAVADRVSSLLSGAGIEVKKDPSRKWDHGVFVPMMLMYPEADIPIISLSVHSSLDPELHLNMGRALAPLRDEGVLIIGSGMSFHNFAYFFARDTATKRDGFNHSHVWNDYLMTTLVSGGLSRQEQLDRLKVWSSAPSATEAHPLGQEEHLIPLHVVLGAAGNDSTCSLVGVPDTDKSEFSFSNFEWK